VTAGLAGEIVERDGTSIAWRSHGPTERPALVLLHSLGMDSTMWAPQLATLAGPFRVVVMDMRGHGRSDAPPGPYTMAELALDVLAVADAAGLERFHLCGLSIGGQMALWLAVHRPERLRSLVLADTAARIGSETSWTQRMDAVRAGGMASIAEGVLANWFSDSFSSTDPERYAAARERLLSTSAQGYIGCCWALATSDLGPRLKAVNVPTLVVTGSADKPTPPSQARRLRDGISGSELAIIEGAAHISNLDAAVRFDRSLVAFLDRQEQEPPAQP
jgi:3-oxoadipate enol-lactonase